MNEEYLWDRSGEPDPEIERLERVLAPLRYRHRGVLAGPPVRRSRAPWRAAVAAAAVIAVAAGILTLAIPSAPRTDWQVASLTGAASMAGKQVAVSTALGAGQLLRTGGSSHVTLEADEVGKIDLGPESELRASSGHKVLLQRGQLHAFIWAPPREFVVDTPSARAVDLGCEYTLNVDSSGNGLIHVEMGWVAFQYDDRESFIPAGAECVTRKAHGPGIPFFGDAPAPMRAWLERFEAGDSSALTALLAAARPRDGLTVWHLLARVPLAQRADVFDRLAQLVNLPPEVTRAAVMQGDRHALDRCWDALNLEDTAWWRGWERRWQ